MKLSKKTSQKVFASSNAITSQAMLNFSPLNAQDFDIAQMHDDLLKAHLSHKS